MTVPSDKNIYINEYVKIINDKDLEIETKKKKKTVIP